MNKTYQTEIYRTFLINGLPEPLTPASSHLQIFDNYIENTRIRLRSVRIPEDNKWTWTLQQRFPVKTGDFSVWKTSQLFLNESEYQAFEQFEGREIRKNRYFHEFAGKTLEFDIYLGKLWGLNLMNVYFETPEEMKEFVSPPFVVYEVTNNEFFTGESLIGKSFTDVQVKFQQMQHEENEKV
jgi:CYTH domain-containing protein